LIKMDFKSLAMECNGRLLNDQFASSVFEGISIDSRTIEPSQLFVAIRGQNNDGHNYIDNALKNHSAGVLVSSDYSGKHELIERIPAVEADDTHKALMNLARAYRSQVNSTIIGVTGSNGKTTTKEFIYGMVHYYNNNAYRSPGNLNNLFGLPLAIFRMPEACEFGVFELGISIPGEMTDLANIIKPDIAVITNVGPTHLETLGSIEGVARAKCELIDEMASDKPVLVNADDPILMHAARKKHHELITFGVNNSADFMAKLIGVDSDGMTKIEIENKQIKINLFGEHQVYNVIAAYAVCKLLELNINPDDLNNIDFDFGPYRGQIENIEGLIVIADCYNANPVSLESGLKSFRKYIDSPELSGRRSIAIVGDMLELGSDAEEYHRKIGRLLAELNFDRVYAVGELARETRNAAINSGYAENKINFFEKTDDAGEALLSDIERGNILFLKASRGIGLDKILTLLRGTALRQN